MNGAQVMVGDAVFLTVVVPATSAPAALKLMVCAGRIAGAQDKVIFAA